MREPIQSKPSVSDLLTNALTRAVERHSKEAGITIPKYNQRQSNDLNRRHRQSLTNTR